MGRFLKSIRKSYEGDFKCLWLSCLAVLIADLLDIIISAIDSWIIPPWKEGNPFAAHPVTEKFLIGAAMALHLEAYILLYLPMALLIYYSLRCCFARRPSALILSLGFWYLAYEVLGKGVLGNVAILVFYFGWLRHLIH
jgi:hypothetical protein